MIAIKNSAAYSIQLILNFPASPDFFNALMQTITTTGADLTKLTTLPIAEKNRARYGLLLHCRGLAHEQEVAEKIRALPNVVIELLADRVFAAHKNGKMRTAATLQLNTRDDLAIAYTPGVARPCLAIHDDVRQANNLTIKGKTVAVVSDGTAVLGLGDIGPEAALPVMEGKCLLFKQFADVDAFPICVATKDVEEIVKLVQQLSPTFGGINLEDISAPRCFAIEEKLKATMTIPIFHDDQHGTAIVALAALYNALKIVNKKIADLKIVVCGIGAAGVACTKILQAAGAKNIIGVDSVGIIFDGRKNGMNAMKEWFAQNTNAEKLSGTLSDAIKGADLFIGVSQAGVLKEDDVKAMAKDAIVFAMANPVPEIMPEIASKHVKIMATGRSDYPNQINNVLAFPGIFRGALDARASAITENMKMAAAKAIANCVSENELSTDYIIPSPFTPNIGQIVGDAVRECAINDGVGVKDILPMPIFAELKR